MPKFRFNRNFNINRVVKRLVRSVLALYVGGTIVSTFGDVMANTTSAFYTGLSLIGWTVQTNAQTNGTTGCLLGCGQTPGLGAVYATDSCNATNAMVGVPNCITSTSGSGVLAVVGIIAIAQIVTEFITW